MVKLNPMKTDLLWCATHQCQRQLYRYSLFGRTMIRLSSPVYDLGVIIDREMSFSSYISQLIRRCFYQLRCIKNCMKAFLTDVATCNDCSEQSYSHITYWLL